MSLEDEGRSKNNQVKIKWRTADAVCFDVDSTVCRDEAIDELAKFVGKFGEVSEVTKAAMGGGLDFRSALAKRLEIIKPSRSNVEQYIKSHPPRLTDHIKELVSILTKRGVIVYLVSGGFDVIIEPTARELGVPMNRVYANTIHFQKDGSYAGFDEEKPTSKQEGKSIVIETLKKTYGYKNMFMIGDGATDLEACPPADAFIGFGGNQVREFVKEHSNWYVYDFKELIDVLASSHQTNI